MRTVWVLRYYKGYRTGENVEIDELLGVFTEYSIAWDYLEAHAKHLGKKLDLSNADMGAILFDEFISDDTYHGGYGLEEEILDKMFVDA